ncbi:Uncharacterized protein BP5553_00111 [Venustampulla echinocandica]|uniref:Transferase family protein n=1 Tax=Venustampulla echinocandica TaxID=2656787 RepID=A0A370TX73_9HELO|nr:Uncharacterized protein BP5553_00111 [Venustampulla echinocandica]RDL40132.1 Uncharacterized protein BP5553_00111 [Venustampulla echinocandica]
MASPNLHPLGCLDDIMPDIDVPLVLSFRCPSAHHPATEATLSHSFTSLIHANYWLSGYIHSNLKELEGKYRPGTKFLSIQSQDWDSVSGVSEGTKENTSQIEFQDLSQHVLYSSTSYPELVAQDMPSRYLSAELLVPDRSTPDLNVKSALRARVTFIRDGIFVVLSTSHALMDATSLSAVFGAWAAIARGEPSPPLSHGPILSAELGLQDRHEKGALQNGTLEQNSSLDPSVLYADLKTQKKLWWMLGLDYRPKAHSSAIIAQNIPAKETLTKIFKINGDTLTRLKKYCSQTETATLNETVGDSDESKEVDTIDKANGAWISTNDALSALLWRCMVRSRIRTAPELSSRTSSLMSAMNMRSSPALTPSTLSYSPRLANIVLYIINTSPIPNLVSSPPNPNAHPSTTSALASTALNIRSATHAYTAPELVAQALQLAATVPDVSRLGLVYPTWLEHDVVISSLLRLPLYSTSWGNTFGKPESGELRSEVPDFVRWPGKVFEGITFVMPRRRDGGVEVVVTMGVEDMEVLKGDAEWRRYVEG